MEVRIFFFFSSITKCVESVHTLLDVLPNLQMMRSPLKEKNCHRMNARELLNSNMAVTSLSSPLPQSVHALYFIQYVTGLQSLVFLSMVAPVTSVTPFMQNSL